MKKLLYITLLLCFAQLSFAQNIVEANTLYSIEKYDEAIEIYENILSQGNESCTLYYNLGNAYYKKNDIASAILNYERALRLDPNNEDVKFNLDLAKTRTVDKIDSVQDFFVSSWFNSVANKNTSNAWAVWNIVLFIAVLVFALLFFFVRVRRLKKASFFLALIALFFCIFTMIFASKQKNRMLDRSNAIVFAETVVVKGSPDESGTELFLLHSGTKVHIKSTFGNSAEWIEIELEDGNSGWMEAKNVEII